MTTPAAGPADPAADLAALDEATERLAAAVAALDAKRLAGPSLLPGWSRGHVVAHLSRNADALVNVLQGRPMYPSTEARDAEIERDSGRSPEAQYADLRDSAARLREAAGAIEGAAWESTVELRNGITDRASSIPFRRLVEVELHHVDLDTGYPVDALPGSFTDRALDYLTRRFAGNPDVAPLELRAEDGRSWLTGSGGGSPLVVTGTPTALVGWLAGRTGGSGLSAAGSDGGAALPVLPAL